MTAFAATARCARGETFVVALRVAGGDLSGGACRMAIKRAPGEENPELAVLETAWMDHIDSDDAASPPGWSGVLAAGATLGLPAGRYAMDARIERDGIVIQTDPVALELTERVTEAD